MLDCLEGTDLLIAATNSVVTVIGTTTAGEIARQTAEMMTTTDLVDENGLETVETDMSIESGLQTGGGEGAEIETIVTGETTLMTGLEDAGRTLLTRGPVTEARRTGRNLQADRKV